MRTQVVPTFQAAPLPSPSRFLVYCKVVRGFTLAELMVSMGLFALVSLGLLGVFLSSRSADQVASRGPIVGGRRLAPSFA